MFSANDFFTIAQTSLETKNSDSDGCGGSDSDCNTAPPPAKVKPRDSIVLFGGDKDSYKSPDISKSELCTCG